MKIIEKVIHLIFSLISFLGFQKLTYFVIFVVTFRLSDFPWKVFCCHARWVYMWIKNIQIIFHLVVDNYEFLFAHDPWKLIKIYKFRPQGATILGVINRWKMQHSYTTLLKNGSDNGFLLYIGSVFGNFNAI
jgi:hypothetical protein